MIKGCQSQHCLKIIEEAGHWDKENRGAKASHRSNDFSQQRKKIKKQFLKYHGSKLQIIISAFPDEYHKV